MRFYCLEDNKDFYAEVSWGTHVICDVGPHDLGKRFPDEPFWEHCGHCEATWVAREQGMSPRSTCPACRRKLELAYLCHICETFCLRYAEGIDHDKDLTNGGAICGGCSSDLTSLRWHYCVNLGKPFLSKRDECPLCDASFFPTTAQELLSSMKGHSYQLARISDEDREYLSLVPASIDNPDESQFFVLGGTHGAIVVPRYTTRSMIDQRTRKYQQVFDWSSEWTGDILIERPAVVEFAGKGWRLKIHGQLAGVAAAGQKVQLQPDVSEYSEALTQKSNDHEERSIELSSPSVKVERISNTSSNESKTSEQTTFAVSQPHQREAAAELFRAEAKSLYRNFVAGGSVTNNLIYLDLKSTSKAGLRNTAEFLKEASSQGAFVVFVGDENQGWVFPNPKLTFNADALKPLFATLTADQFYNFKEHIEPVPVGRIGNGRWQVEAADRPSSEHQDSSAAPTEPQTSEPAKFQLVFPASAADCLAKTQSSAKVVRYDIVRDLLVTGPNGKGELALIRNPGRSEKSDSLFAIPRVTKFRSADTFHNLFKRYYDCRSPSAGEVWIMKPAVVTKGKEGWDLLEKGRLEIDYVAKRPPLPKQEPLPEVVNVKQERVGKTEPEDESPKEPRQESFIARPLLERRLRLVIAFVAILVLLAATLVAIRRGPSPQVEIRKASPSPTPTNMISISGGAFQMGNNAGDTYEKPAHPVIVKPFLIDPYEVTCEEYLKFVKEKNHRAPSNWVGGEYPNGAAKKPVTGVDWDDATAYASWAGKRLPTEEEWEFAARGTDGRRYPWGDDWRPDAANADGVSQGLADVGTYRNDGSLKLYDMIGNAWEWTASPLQPYPGGHLPAHPAGDLKVIRGGSWQSDRNSATTTYRFGWPARGGKDYRNTSFRCALDAKQPEPAPVGGR